MTVSIVARSADGASWGVAVASKFLAVGALWLRIPLAIAWSTPGAAVLLAAAGHGITFSNAVGAFLVSAALIVL